MKKILLLGLLVLSVIGIAMATPNDASDKKKEKVECCCEDCTCKDCIYESDCSDCKGCQKDKKCGECRECCEEKLYDCCDYYRDLYRKLHKKYRWGDCCGRRC